MPRSRHKRIAVQKLRRRILKKFLLLIFCMLIAVSVFGQTERAESSAADSIITEIYLAKDEGGSIGESAENFSTSDVPIYCVIKLETAKPTLIKMNLVAVKVRGVKPETKVVTVSYQTNGIQDQVNFTGKPAGVWTAGSYRVDIFVDGKAAGNKEFEIQNKDKETQIQPTLIKNLAPPKIKNPRSARKN